MSLQRSSVIFSLFLFCYCANEIAPSGGKKDEDPPKIVSANPPNLSLNFNSDKIRFKFNEYLENTSFSKTIISPATNPSPKFKVNLNKITVYLPQHLQPNTTYIINFADDVKDINESNILKNFIYVFSTGDHIDSQRVEGNICDAFTREPEENMLVMLYDKDSLNQLFSGKPRYFAFSDKSGNFAVNFLKPGEYALAALKDQNSNFIYDQQSEKIAFSSEPINLVDKAKQEVNLQSFYQKLDMPKIIAVEEIIPGKINIVFNNPIQRFKAEGHIFKNSHVAYFNENNDTLTVWYSKANVKTDIWYYSINDTIQDSVSLKYLASDTPNKEIKYTLKIDKQPFKAVTQLSNSTPEIISPYEQVVIHFSSPVTEIKDDLDIQLKNDSTGRVVSVKATIEAQTRLSAKLTFPLKNSTYKVLIPKGMFKSIHETYNDSTTLFFQTDAKDLYGNLKIRFTQRPFSSVLLELLDNKGIRVSKVYLSNEVETSSILFKNLREGKYTLRIIYDENSNGRWDSGNIFTRTQPEKVNVYKNLPELKGAWEAEFEVGEEKTILRR
ncbi:MAG: Ig-like domain-containing protein [Chitinophagales bacterium]|nr:Ig-like domain-containing protein [Chitinophagales bacterium]